MNLVFRNSRVIAVLVAGLLGFCVSAARAADAVEDASNRLNQLFADFSVASRPLFPLIATANGWHEYDDQFANDISDAHREQQRAWCRSYRTALDAFSRDALGDDDRLSYDLFRYNLERCLARLELDLHLLPINQSGFSLTATFPIFASGKGAHPFRNARDYDNLLRRIPGFIDWMDTAAANMRRGIEREWTQPRALMDGVVAQLEAMIVDDVKQSLFYQPILNMPQTIAPGDRDRLALAYEAAIRDQIVPAYRRLRDFVRDEYMPRCRTTVGLDALPGGDQLYQYYLEANTTTTLTPDEIFELGERELARTWQKVEALKRASGYTGEVKNWAAKLRAEAPVYETAEEAMAAYRAMHEEVSQKLDRFFARLPATQYEIRAVEDYREAGAPSQYWSGSETRPAVFYVNLRGVKTHPVTASMTLFLHETLPGHHLQISLARENSDLPYFRRVANYPMFAEGWARYAQSLGIEMGLYKNTYQQLVWLNSELWATARLVADVGIHVKGWTLEQALQFVAGNTVSWSLDGDHAARDAREVERFMALPGFAPAYKIGQLRISNLRTRAEHMLGPQFDLRAFHDELLKDGAMPLDLLDAKIARWIDAQRSASAD